MGAMTGSTRGVRGGTQCAHQIWQNILHTRRDPDLLLHEAEVLTVARLLQVSEQAVRLARRDYRVTMVAAKRSLPVLGLRSMRRLMKNLFPSHAAVYAREPAFAEQLARVEASAEAEAHTDFLDCYLSFRREFNEHVPVAKLEWHRVSKK